MTVIPAQEEMHQSITQTIATGSTLHLKLKEAPESSSRAGSGYGASPEGQKIGACWSLIDMISKVRKEV